MSWSEFPYSDAGYVYTPDELKSNWTRLHRGDLEPFPDDPALLKAWIAFHAGQFEQAADIGLAQGVHGYSVANKASCIYANYLENSMDKKMAIYEAVTTRCVQQQALQPKNPATYYWYAYALIRYAQGLSVVKALSQGIGKKVELSFWTALDIAPRHSDAHVGLGNYHSDLVYRLGGLAAAYSYGATRFTAMAHYRTALLLYPSSALACIEYAKALLILDSKKMRNKIIELREKASILIPHDATEQLYLNLARDAIAA